jgi:ketosteroid isomerase-like protein
MEEAMRIFLFVVAAALVGAPSALSAKTVHQAALPVSAGGADAAVDAFHSALRRGDTSAAAALLADDALVFEEGGAERSKTEYVAKHLPADAAFSKGVVSSVVRRFGGFERALAWVSSEGRTTGTYKGREIDAVTTETMILRRIRGVWKIVHIHWSTADGG